MLKKNIKSFVLLMLSLSCTIMFAQIPAGDKYFDRGDYVNAIPKYKKASKSKVVSEKQTAYVKLANTYVLVNQYENAEVAFANALAIDTLSLAPEVYYNYAEVLKANNKYEQASKQYQHYVRLSPNDENAKNALKFCKDIQFYLARPIEYEAQAAVELNTSKSEFSPFVSNGNLVYVAEREEFDIINYSQQETNGNPYLNIYVSNVQGEQVKNTKKVSGKINTDYHDGPACVSPDGNTLYFTRTEYVEKKGFVNNSKLYVAKGTFRHWKNPKPIDELNSNDYSVAQPYISNDGMTLYFSSTMPGGLGGKDIWQSRYDTVSKKWGEPENLGPEINTARDEMFPTMHKNGTLYFSSNGWAGYGGLDICSAKKRHGDWLFYRNEGLDINSSKDDFGIAFLNDSLGYFASDRTGGKGRDDIYRYKYTKKLTDVEGTVLLTENMTDYAKRKKVYLLDENGTTLDSTRTDAMGFFWFRNVPTDKTYMSAVDASDPEFAGKARFYLMETDSNVIHRVSNHFKDNKFVFKNLPLEPNALPDLSTNDELVLAGNLLYGKEQSPLKNTKLSLVSDRGDVLESTTTNEFGSFAFRNIPSEQNYLISIEDGDIQLPAGTKVVLTNKAGKELKTFVKGSGKFSFRLMKTDKNTIDAMHAEDENLTMDVFGYMYDQNKKPLVNTKVRVSDERGYDEQEFHTNDKGRFRFKNLSAEKNYIFELDGDDPTLRNVIRIYVADARGRIYKVIELANGRFTFKMLETDKQLLGEFMVDEPWMTLAKIKEKERPKDKVDIYGFLFGENKTPLPYIKLTVHDINGGDLQMLSTNDQGRFNFKKIATETDYLFETEEGDPNLKGLRRVYIADSKGDIYKVLDLSSGKFSFKMVDMDKAALGEFNVDDPWMKVGMMKGKAKDVKDIMGFVYDQNKHPIVNVKLKVRSEDGSEEQLISTNEQGLFNFKKLAGNKNYMFETEEGDPNLKGVKRMYIADAAGEIYKVLDFVDGKFAFRVLDLDKVALSDIAVNEDIWLTSVRLKDKKKTNVKEDNIVFLDEPKKTQPIKTSTKPEKTKPTPSAAKTPGNMFSVDAVHYAYGKFEVTPEMAVVLDKAAGILQEHENLLIEIRAHADAQSSSGFNMRLTYKRATAAEKYLIKQGVDKDRIVKKCYGETQIINKCTEGVECSDEEHSVNRRTEFKFVDK